jgi:hypothetical protein
VVFQIFLNLVSPTIQVLAFHNPSVTALVGRIRGEVRGWSDFSATGLNGAFALGQGGPHPNRVGNKAGCMNINSKRPYTEGHLFIGFVAARRCSKCNIHLNRRGVDRTVAEVETARCYASHTQITWSARVEKTPHCRKRFNGNHNHFYFGGGARRCRACSVDKRKNGVEGPLSAVQTRRENRAQVRCTNVHCQDPFMVGGQLFFGYGPERRCSACYQYQGTTTAKIGLPMSSRIPATGF